MLINERNTRILLSESRKSPLYGQYDEYEIAAAIILESKTEIPYDIILTEGWFGDKIKQVGKALNKYIGEPAKHGWAKWMPSLYDQQTYKFWKRGDLRKEAEAAFEKVLEDLEDLLLFTFLLADSAACLTFFIFDIFMPPAAFIILGMFASHLSYSDSLFSSIFSKSSSEISLSR